MKCKKLGYGYIFFLLIKAPKQKEAWKNPKLTRVELLYTLSYEIPCASALIT